MARITKKDQEQMEKEVSESQNPNINPDVLRAIKTAKMSLKKKFGDDLFSEKKVEALPSISTGSTLIDAEIGNNGFVLGRIHEIFGESGCGKSSMCTILCKNALLQYPDKFIIYLDYEQAMNFAYAKQLGLDVEDERVIFLQPSSAEEGFEVAETLIKTGGVSLVVFDSVPAMMTKAELEKGYDEMTIGSKAKFLSTSLPKLLELIRINNTAVLFVNQIRSNITMYGAGGGTTPGKNN